MKPYQRGDVVEINVPIPASGHVQGGKRPWIIVQYGKSVFSHIYRCTADDQVQENGNAHPCRRYLGGEAVPQHGRV